MKYPAPPVLGFILALVLSLSPSLLASQSISTSVTDRLNKPIVLEINPSNEAYGISVPELEKGNLSAAIPLHRTLTAFDGDKQPLISLSVTVDPVIHTAKLAEGSPGFDLNSKYFDLITALAERNGLQSGSYDLRQVEGRGRNRFVFFWLKSEAGTGDFLYSLYGFEGTKVFPHRVYSIAEFQQVIHDSNVATLTGTVIANGQPLPGGEVTLVIGNFAKTWKATTDGNGVFTFTDLPCGMEYSVSAESTGLIGVEQGSPLPVGNTTRLPKPLELGRPCTISGTVLEQDGQPAAKAVIAYLHPHWEYGMKSDSGLATKTINVGGTASGSTDAAGHFTLSGIPAGQYIVTAVLRPDGMQPP
ncbi:MAG TPA: carboxypeptidase-like regulatory domain-containing protein [Opitutales bacterium]|nr:carboxypeptidase-like regulatory domain-containing protein [Opitutales bacterium]